MTTASDAGIPAERTLRDKLKGALVTPIRAMRLRYLPLLMIYFAYGALGLVGIAQAFWIKQALTFTPAELAAVAVWLTLPWTIKMVFGQLADSVPIFGSRRRVYVLIGASLVASGMIILAGAAGGWIAFVSKNALYVMAQLLIVVGVVLQDVIADAMTTEVVERLRPDGTPRPKAEIERELGLVQVLGRLALWTESCRSPASRAGSRSSVSYETVFLLGSRCRLPLSPAPCWSVSSRRNRSPSTGASSAGAGVRRRGLSPSALSGLPLGQELVFVISLTVIALMLARIGEELDEVHRKRIFYAALVIFLYRASPGVGEGYRWFTIDVLGFDEAFYGTLAQIGAGLSLAGAWLFSDIITRQPIAKVLLWLTIVGTILSLPTSRSRCAGTNGPCEFRFRRARHRAGRYDGDLAIRRAQHDPGAHARRHQRAGGSPRHMVRADGLADECGAGGGSAPDQISQPSVRGRPRLLCRPRRADHRRGRHWLRRAGRRHPRLRQARDVTPCSRGMGKVGNSKAELCRAFSLSAQANRVAGIDCRRSVTRRWKAARLGAENLRPRFRILDAAISFRKG